MPRNSQGLYTLPSSNPVTPGTLIEAAWANDTMSDIAEALTKSLPRDGTAPMTGQLTLVNALATDPRHATSKSYVDKFMAYATGMPVASVFAFAGAPGLLSSAYLLCDGSAYSRTDYAALFAAIGTSFGAGDGATTFNVPDSRGWFIRGRDPSSRTVGSKEQDGNKSHNHPLTDPGHNHVVTNPAHSHGLTQTPHAHGVNDPGHTHTLLSTPNERRNGSDAIDASGGSQQTTSRSVTGISLAASNANISLASATQATTVASTTTGISILSEGSEARPKNIAMDYYIKAKDDAVAPVTPILGITSSDDYIISVGTGNPVYPNLEIHSNVALGLVKLDATGKIPASLLPSSAQTYLGAFDASTGLNPTEKYPTQTFDSGDTFLVIAEGMILVYDPITYVESMTLAVIGSNLIYTDNGVNPAGWYYIVDASVQSIVAADVAIVPIPGRAATQVQQALEEYDNALDANAAALDDHISDVSAHGATSAVVGISDSQTLTNKLIDGNTNRIINSSVDELLSGVGGSGDAITATTDTEITSYIAGQSFAFVAIAPNTGPVTININSISSVAITKTGNTQLSSGDIVLGQLVSIRFDGTRFQVVSGAGGSGGGAVASGAIYENAQIITANYTITSGKNAMSAGPITVADGVTVTIPNGSTWSIV